MFSLPKSAAKWADFLLAARSAASSFILFIFWLGLNGLDSGVGVAIVACLLFAALRRRGVDGDVMGVGICTRCRWEMDG